MILPLGTLRAVAPRTMWPDRTADFTPWLAEPENTADRPSRHRRNARSQGLAACRARLAVGVVTALVQFLFETLRERQNR